MAKTILMTGASSDIGQAIIKRLAIKGDTVLLLGRNTPKLGQIAKALQRKGINGKPVRVDLSNTADTQKAAERITMQVQAVDILVHAAGVYHNGRKAFADIPFTEYSTDHVLASIHVGITGAVLLCHTLLPLMSDRGSIVTISGTFEDGAKGWLPYYISKKALEHFTVGLSQELVDSPIRVNCVSPSDTYTSSYRTFFPQYADPETNLRPQDVADMVGFLCSPQAQHITGQIVEVKKGS